jgi:hypothetical protein
MRALNWRSTAAWKASGSWFSRLAWSAAPAWLSSGLQGGDPLLKSGKAARELVQVSAATIRCSGSGRGPWRAPWGSVIGRGFRWLATLLARLLAGHHAHPGALELRCRGRAGIPGGAHGGHELLQGLGEFPVAG